MIGRYNYILVEMLGFLEKIEVLQVFLSLVHGFVDR